MWTRSQAVQNDTQVKLLRAIKKTWLRYFQLSWFALSDWSKKWCCDDETSFRVSSRRLVPFGRQALSLNKTLIVLHFLDTCVKDHSVIKKKHVSCRLRSHFQSRKGHPEFKIEVSCCMRQELLVLSLLNHLSFWPHSNCKQEGTLSRTRLQICWDVLDLFLCAASLISGQNTKCEVGNWRLNLRYYHPEQKYKQNYKQNQFKIQDFLWSWYKPLAWFMWNGGGSEADWATVAMILIDAFVSQPFVGSTEDYSDSWGLIRVKRLHVVLWQSLTLWWGDRFSPYSICSHLRF